MIPVQIFVGPRDPYDKKVEGLIVLRVFEARTLLISNPDHSAYFFCEQDNLLGGQFWAMGGFNSLGGQNNLLGHGGQLPTQLTCYLPPWLARDPENGKGATFSQLLEILISQES